MKTIFFKKTISVLIVILVFGYVLRNAVAQDSQSSLYVPLIGITLIPEPLVLPNGTSDVTYKYAVKNFIEEISLTDIRVIDDTCSSVKFVEGDDDGDSRLDYDETWRYACNTILSETTQSTATATGKINDIVATHKAYATVVVGSELPPPLVNIVNVTKVAYPLSLPVEGGDITFTYKVNNPGVVPLSNVAVVDDKCSALSSKLGDRNANSLLDTNEIWIYTCTTVLKETTTNTVSVTAYANGLKASGSATITVRVEGPTPGFQDSAVPSFPETGLAEDFKIIVWSVLSGILAGLVVFYLLNRRLVHSKHEDRGVQNKFE